MRPLWNGSISFGLVNIPVRMFSAVESREGIDFRMLHKTDNGPIRYARICREDGKEVDWDDIVKGYEYEEDKYVVFTPEQLDQLSAEKSSTIDIQQFVKEGDIDIRYFDKPYYLEPVKGGEKNISGNLIPAGYNDCVISPTGSYLNRPAKIAYLSY